MSDLNGKRKRVLIVEDDMIISLVIENMVKELGHEVVGKATGDEAIRLATSMCRLSAYGHSTERRYGWNRGGVSH